MQERSFEEFRNPLAVAVAVGHFFEDRLVAYRIKPGTQVWYPRTSALDDGHGVVLKGDPFSGTVQIRDNANHFPHYIPGHMLCFSPPKPR